MRSFRFMRTRIARRLDRARPALLIAGWLTPFTSPTVSRTTRRPRSTHQPARTRRRHTRARSRRDDLSYSAIGQIRARWGAQAFSGTGTLISADKVVTAAHCVYRADLGGWADEVIFTPARNGTIEPFGTASVVAFSIPDGYVDRKRQVDDVAIVTLNKPLGDTAGFIPLAAESGSLENLAVYSAGYPADKPGHQMYFVDGVTTGFVGGLLYMDLDASSAKAAARSGSMTKPGPRSSSRCSWPSSKVGRPTSPSPPPWTWPIA